MGPCAGYEYLRRDMERLAQIQDDALNVYAMGFASQSIQTSAKLVHNDCYDYSRVFSMLMKSSQITKFTGI